MKSKKIIVMLIVTVMCLGLVACRKNNEEGNSNNSSSVEDSSQIVGVSGEMNDDTSGEIRENDEVISSEYFDFVNQFNEEIRDFHPALRTMDNYLKAGPDANYKDYGVSSFLNSVNRSEDYFSKMSYVLKDLNNDGGEEFLLYYDSEELKNIIISMSTMIDGICYCVFNSQEDMIFSLYENDFIKVEFLDEEYVEFTKLDEKFELDVVDSIEKNTPENEAQAIIDKYSEAKLELKSLR